MDGLARGSTALPADLVSDGGLRDQKKMACPYRPRRRVPIVRMWGVRVAAVRRWVAVGVRDSDLDGFDLGKEAEDAQVIQNLLTIRQGAANSADEHK